MSLKETLLKKANENREKNAKIMTLIPEKYHHFVMVLERSATALRTAIQLDKELEAAGYYVKDGKTFLKTESVYLTVAGKNAILVDWAEENNYRFSIENEVVLVGQKPFVKAVVTITNDKGEIIRRATSTVPVNVGGSGIDATNPYENAETSAVGRALTFLGMGQTGDIASYEEVVISKSREKENNQESGFLVDSFEFKDDAKNAGFVTLVDLSTGEYDKVAGWGEVWKKFIKEVDVGKRVQIKTEPFTMSDKTEAKKLVNYKVVA